MHGWRDREGVKWVKGVRMYKFPVIKEISSGEGMYSVVTKVNSTVCILKVAKSRS